MLRRIYQKFPAIRPSVQVWKKLMLVLIVFAVGLLAFCWGRHGALSEAKANPPEKLTLSENITPVSDSDYGKRVVAFIYNNVPITREDLGEYLIARFGAQRLEFLVNRRIIEMACKAKNIFVTDSEVNAELQDNLKAFGLVNPKDFEAKVLRRYNKTIYEWREDVIRPKLLLAKLARPRVVVTDKDLHDAFEARYGDKVQCHMILLPQGMPKSQMEEMRAKVMKDEKAFMEEARKQFMQSLAAKGGEIPPIHRHFGDLNIEREAFSLKPGEVSSLVELPDKTVALLRCDKLLGADQTKNFGQERLNLHREVSETKLQMEIPKVFKEMHDMANPRFLMDRGRATGDEIRAQVQQELQQTSGTGPRPTPPPLQK